MKTTYHPYPPTSPSLDQLGDEAERRREHYKAMRRRAIERALLRPRRSRLSLSLLLAVAGLWAAIATLTWLVWTAVSKGVGQ